MLILFGAFFSYGQQNFQFSGIFQQNLFFMLSTTSFTNSSTMPLFFSSSHDIQKSRRLILAKPRKRVSRDVNGTDISRLYLNSIQSGSVFYPSVFDSEYIISVTDPYPNAYPLQSYPYPTPYSNTNMKTNTISVIFICIRSVYIHMSEHSAKLLYVSYCCSWSFRSIRQSSIKLIKFH